MLFLTGALHTAAAQPPAAPKAAQAQDGSQTRSVAKSRANEKRRALEDAGLGAADVDDLIGTLEDPDARGRLLNQLKALKAGADTAAPPADIQPSRFGGRIVESLSDRIDRVSEELVGGATMVLDAPRLVDWAQRQMSVPENRRIWVEVLWKVLVVLGAGLVAEWVVRLMLARTRKSVEGQERDSVWMRLPFLLPARCWISSRSPLSRVRHI